MNLLELLNRVIPILSSATSRGEDNSPLNVLASVKTLLAQGGKIGLSETAAVAKAIGVASSYETLKEEDRRFLRDTWSELTAHLDKYTYKSWEQAEDEGAVEIAASVLRAADESEGLEWKVRVIESGKTVDGRHVYSPDAVRSAAELFDGAQCFADHAPEGENPSVNNLVGWFSDPEIVSLDEDKVAVEATLHVLESSPFAKLLREIYQRQAADKVGFSIHGNGKVRLDQQNGVTIRVVESIDKISSVDLVTKPNAGGKLLDLRAGVYKAADMLPDIKIDTGDSDTDIETDEGEVEVQESVDTKYSEDLMSLKAELEQMKLESGREKLIASYNLPDTAMEIVRPRLSKANTLDEMESVLKEAQTVWSAAVETQARETPLFVQTQEPTRHIIRLQGLIAGSPVDGVQPYSGLREAYSDISGLPSHRFSPQQFANAMIRSSQGYDSANVLRETIATGDWAYSLGQAIYRQMIREYNLPGFDDWRKVVSDITNLRDMRTNDRMRTGYYDLLPVVNEDNTYQPLTDPTEERAHFAPHKRGGLADYTWEATLNDDLGMLRAIPRKLALSAKVTLWYNILNIFISNPETSYDNTELFHTDHNDNTVSETLTAANWANAVQWMRTSSVLGNDNIPMGLAPKFLIIPPDLEATARKLRESDVDIDALTDLENVANIYKGSFEIIIIPFWGNAAHWVTIADPNLIPTIEVGFLGGREEPELFTEAQNSGTHFTADKITYKIRHVWGYCILDHRGMYKGTG